MVETIVINDVGPRDGLQNQSKTLQINERLQLIRALLKAKVSHIEVGSFVSPKAVPAMAGTGELLKALGRSSEDLSVLIPNLRGYELALEAGAKTVAMVVYPSDGMAKKKCWVITDGGRRSNRGDHQTLKR